ncbi:MAG: alpha/beta hydrolase [Syntrophobacteraceae bacterium]|jgi:pimeloyl-ACP methyl ester carboxylesterase
MKRCTVRVIRLMGGLLVLLLMSALLPAAVAHEGELKPLSITLEGYDYAYRVEFLHLIIEGQDLRMAYMDVQPRGEPNGKTVVLLHGKNFFGNYWKDTIRFLTQNGFRVVAPDQIGFGKSSKPNIHYSFHLLAANTKKLIDTLAIKQASIVGHSMGGMLATRFTLMYPETVTHLVLANPIGLEDYREFVPYEPLEELYRAEMNITEESIRNYHRTYYSRWKAEYDEYVAVAARCKMSGEYPRLAMASALTYQMIYEQPVCHEFADIKAKTLLVIGQTDRTVVGKAKLKKELLPVVGQYPELGRKTAKLIPGAKLIEIPGVGHIPHFEATERFHEELLTFVNQ